MAKIVEPSVELYPMPVFSELRRLEHIERCGRTCYKSEGKISDGSAQKFVEMVINRGHESVLEHAWITVEVAPECCNDTLRAIVRDIKLGLGIYMRYTPSHIGAVVSGNARAWRDMIGRMIHVDSYLPFPYQRLIRDNPVLFSEYQKHVDSNATNHVDSPEIDPASLRQEERLTHEAITLKFVCDRGISHEIVRHRPASYSQESTRYCNYSKDQFGGEITVIEPFGHKEMPNEAYSAWCSAVCNAEKAYFEMLDAGISPQIARDALPTCLKTELVMTAACDEWIHFLNLRTSPAAHPKIRELATQARILLEQVDPQIFRR